STRARHGERFDPHPFAADGHHAADAGPHEFGPRRASQAHGPTHDDRAAMDARVQHEYRAPRGRVDRRLQMLPASTWMARLVSAWPTTPSKRTTAAATHIDSRRPVMSHHLRLRADVERLLAAGVEHRQQQEDERRDQQVAADA